MAGGEIAKMYATIGADTSGFEAGVKRADKQLKGFESSTNSISGVIEGFTRGALTRLAVGFSVVKAAEFAVELAEVGAQAQRTAAGFDELASSVGASSDKMLEAMRKASAGTISDLKLMETANKAMMLGVGASAEDMGTLLEVARLKGKRMGMDSATSFSDLVTGLGRGQAEILDNLGIVVNAREAQEAYAASVGKTAEQLTAAERKQALLNEVVRTGKAELEAAGGVGEDSADSFERLNASWQNAKTAWGELLAPLLAGGADVLADAATEIKNIADDVAKVEVHSLSGEAVNAWERYAEAERMAAAESESLRAQIYTLENQINLQGDTSEATAKQLEYYQAQLAIAESRAAGLRVEVEKAQMRFFRAGEAANTFAGDLDDVAAAADNAAGSLANMALGFLGFAQGSYGKKSTTLGGLFDYFKSGVEAGNEADIQHRMAVLLNVAEDADVWRKKGKEDSKRFASDWEDAADRVQRAIEDAFQATADAVAQFTDEAANASKQLFDMGKVEGFGGGMAPGQNGPFEALFRATDVAAHGADSEWAAALGLDQESAKRIVADFQAGLMSPDVIGLIDTGALIEHVRRQQEAEQSQKAFAESVAAQAGVDPAAVMQALGIDPGGTAATQLLDGLRAGLAAATPGADVLAAINTDLADRKQDFTTAGGVVANMLFSGMVSGADKSILKGFATALVPMILEAIKDKERRTGGGS